VKRSTTTLRAICAALALALWMASTLGLVHRSVHQLPASSGMDLSLAASARQPSQLLSGHRDVLQAGSLASLFGDHDEGQCRLYDQLSHGPAALAAPVVVLSFALPSATFAYLQGEALARWVALFDARGPPSSR